MPDYLARFDRGPSTRFDAVTDAAAVHYVRELLADEGAGDGESASVYRLDDDANGVEEYIGEATAGDGDQADDDAQPLAVENVPAPLGPIERTIAGLIVRCLDLVATVAADWRDALTEEMTPAT
jgi:hypothetical protein